LIFCHDRRAPGLARPQASKRGLSVVAGYSFTCIVALLYRIQYTALILYTHWTSHAQYKTLITRQ